MGIGAIRDKTKEDIEKEAEDSENQDVKVKREVLRAYQLLADAAGVELGREDYPDVRVKSEKTSYWSPTEREIVIAPHDVNDGIAYFEEASHALRDLVMARKGIPYQKIDQRVQEFYGRIGETLGRDLVKGTELEYLFSNSAPRDRTVLKDLDLMQLQHLRQKSDFYRKRAKIVREGKEGLVGAVKTNFEELDKAFKKFEAGDLSSEQFREEVYQAGVDFGNRLKGIKGGYDSVASGFCKSWSGEYGYLGQILNIWEGSPETNARNGIIKAIGQVRERFYRLDKESPDLVEGDDIDVFKEKLRIEREKHRIDVHRRAYTFAQQYSAEQLREIRDLYALGDEDVKKKFFRKVGQTDRVGGLEKAVAAAFYIISPIFIAYLILNLKLTGAVIGLGNLNSSFGWGLGIIFFLIVLILAWIRLRKRK